MAVFQVRVRLTDTIDLAVLADDPAEAWNKVSAMTVEQIRNSLRHGKHQGTKVQLRFARPSPNSFKVEAM